MLRKIKQRLGPYYTNLRGWRTNRKIVVIESDDWGSIRMPSKRVYNECLKKGYRVDSNPFERFDSLASEDDLEHLFTLLTSFQDRTGNHPVITANILPANPDFKKIKNSGFTEYHYESTTETFKKYPKHSRCFQLWNVGRDNKIFSPQSHGREHLNVSQFMEALQQNNKDVHFGFKHEMPGSIPIDDDQGKNRYVESLRYKSTEDKEHKLKITLEGLDLFYSLMNYKSESFMPQNYLWSPDFDENIFKKGVKYYQGNRKMKEPGIDEETRFHQHWLGQKNKYGQYYLIRNVLFEPSLFRKNINDPVNNCLREISIAFMLKKPAIICSHRINYVGFIDKSNRDKNLIFLKELLQEIFKRWPEVEFMTTSELGNTIDLSSRL